MLSKQVLKSRLDRYFGSSRDKGFYRFKDIPSHSTYCCWKIDKDSMHVIKRSVLDCMFAEDVVICVFDNYFILQIIN